MIEGLGSVWVANSDDGTVTRLDPQTGQVGRRADPRRSGPARAHRRRRASCGSPTPRTTSVSQIDPKTGRVVGRAIPVGDDPIGIAFGNGAVWTANHQDGTVTRITP